MSDHSPTFVSLYAGAGGLDLGFMLAGCEPVWANEADGLAAETYRANVGEHISAGRIEDQEWPEEGAAEIVIGGPPCQGFSVAGHMDPGDPRSQHVSVFFDVVAHIKPRAFVMENVKNLAVNARWATLRESLVLRARRLGYEVELMVLNASHYGVPQSRERMFLMGIRDERPVQPPTTTRERPLAVAEALARLPEFGSVGNDSICAARVTPAKRPVLRRSPFAGMLFNGKGRTLNLAAPAPTLAASMGGNRTPIVDQKQLEANAECWTVGYHARLWAGGEPAKRIPARMRRLTVQEAAAIQTFPSTWRFSGSQSSQFRQIGNAVPPELAREVAQGLVRALRTGSRPKAAAAL